MLYIKVKERNLLVIKIMDVMEVAEKGCYIILEALDEDGGCTYFLLDSDCNSLVSGSYALCHTSLGKYR